MRHTYWVLHGLLGVAHGLLGLGHSPTCITAFCIIAQAGESKGYAARCTRMQGPDDSGCSCPSPRLHMPHFIISELPPAPPSIIMTRYTGGCSPLRTHYSHTRTSSLLTSSPHHVSRSNNQMQKLASASSKRCQSSCLALPCLALPFPPTFSPTKPCPLSLPPSHIAAPHYGGLRGTRLMAQTAGASHLAGVNSRCLTPSSHLAGVLGRLL